jgi:hypothetical protein
MNEIWEQVLANSFLGYISPKLFAVWFVYAQTVVLWITASEWGIPTSRNRNQNGAVHWQIFPSIKGTLANRKKGFYTNRDTNKQGVGLTFVWGGSELCSLFKYSELKLKNQKPNLWDWCPFQGLSNGTTLMQILSGRTVTKFVCTFPEKLTLLASKFENGATFPYQCVRGGGGRVARALFDGGAMSVGFF